MPDVNMKASRVGDYESLFLKRAHRNLDLLQTLNRQRQDRRDDFDAAVPHISILLDLIAVATAQGARKFFLKKINANVILDEPLGVGHLVVLCSGRYLETGLAKGLADAPFALEFGVSTYHDLLDFRVGVVCLDLGAWKGEHAFYFDAKGQLVDGTHVRGRLRGLTAAKLRSCVVLSL